MMYQHLHVTPQPPGRLNPRIPADVDTVILHALAKKPEERFGSISAFARAFEQALTTLARRIDAFIGLPVDELEPAVCKQKLNEIGRL